MAGIKLIFDYTHYSKLLLSIYKALQHNYKTLVSLPQWFWGQAYKHIWMDKEMGLRMSKRVAQSGNERQKWDWTQILLIHSQVLFSLFLPLCWGNPTLSVLYTPRSYSPLWFSHWRSVNEDQFAMSLVLIFLIRCHLGGFSFAYCSQPVPKTLRLSSLEFDGHDELEHKHSL